jgi:small-conductance mechanosensitive channel
MSQKLNLHLILILFFTALLAPSTVFAQQESSTQAVDSLLVRQPQVIPVINIIEEIGKANEDIKDIEQKIRPKQGIVRIDSLLPVYTDGVEERKTLAESFMQTVPNPEEIDNRIRTWNRYRDFFENFQTTINIYEGRNAILLETLSFSEETWELTYLNAEEKEVPTQLLSNVKSVWDDYNNIKGDVVTENNKFLGMQTAVNDQINIIDGILEDLSTLKYSEVYQLFHLRDLPLWKSTSGTGSSDLAEKEGVESVRQNFYETWIYVKSSEQTLYLFVIVIALLLIAIRIVKNSFLKYEMGKVDVRLLRAKDTIINRSRWVIVFLILLAAKFMFQNTPILFDDILLFLLLICAAILVKPFMHKRFQTVPYFVILIFLLDTVETYFWLSHLQYRFYVLFETIVVAAILTYFARPHKITSGLNNGKFGALLLRLVPVYYGIIIISLVSNILGYTNLTEVSERLINRGSQLTLIFYAVLIVAYGIALSFINNHYSRKSDLSHINRAALENKVMRVIRFLVLVFWLYYFLDMVDLYRPLADTVGGVLSVPYKVGGVTFTLGMISSFIAILASSFLITGAISFLLDGQEVKLSFITLPKGIPAAISLVIRYFILAFGFVLALSALGIDLSKFNLLAGALGLGIGFGLQNVVSNFISGIILVFERPILTGDVVEVNNLLGIVSKIGVRSSRISTYDGSEVVVPNNNLISNNLINWTLSNNIRRNEIWIDAAYGSDPNQVLKVLLEIVAENNMVLKTPPPMALFDKFGENALSFRLLFWVYFQNSLGSKSDVSIAIYNRFKELGIEIPLPQRVVTFPENTKGINRPSPESGFLDDASEDV